MPTSNLAPAPKPVPMIRLPFKIMGGFVVLLFLVVGAVGAYRKYVNPPPQTAVHGREEQLRGIPRDSLEYLAIVGSIYWQGLDRCDAAQHCGVVGGGHKNALSNIQNLPSCLQTWGRVCEISADELAQIDPPILLGNAWRHMLRGGVTGPRDRARILKEIMAARGNELPDIRQEVARYGYFDFTRWAKEEAPAFTAQLEQIASEEQLSEAAYEDYTELLTGANLCGTGERCTPDLLIRKAITIKSIKDRRNR